MRFRNLLAEIAHGRVVILSTHIVSDVEAVASKIAMLSAGRLRGVATPEDLLARAAGRVFTAVVPATSVASVQKAVPVSGLVRRADGVHVRYVGRHADLEGARAAEPTLEDAYLFSTLDGDARGVSAFLAAVGAQAAVETRMRLRSPATLFAALLLGAGAVLWIPDPTGRATSLLWTMADGRRLAPEYSSSYLAWAAAMVGALWASLIGFYLVAGSVRRDKRSGVGAILAATPLSDTAYLAGKAASHLLYLGALSSLSVGAALVAFARWGVGPLHAAEFLRSWALYIVPAVVVTACMAVLFDVTPGLRTRGGYVIWFFFFVILASGFNARDSRGRVVNMPRVDPVGMTTLDGRAHRAMPGAVGVSSGLVISDKPLTRVPWPGLKRADGEVAARLTSLLAALVPFAASLLFFDRFDPARGRPRFGLGKISLETPVPADGAAPAAAAALARPVVLAPSAARSVLAEARLAWDAASLLKWPLLAAALAAPFLPAAAFPLGAAGMLLLLGLAVAEVAAREALAGTRGLVFAQPGVPASPVLWKTGAILVFVLAFGLPSAARAAVESPAAGAAFLGGLLFTAGTAASFGSLTGGGKLFLGVYTALWYFAVNRLPIADFTGLFARPEASRTAAYLLAGAAAVGVALAAERRSRA